MSNLFQIFEFQLSRSKAITEEDLDKMKVTRLINIPLHKSNECFIPKSCFGKFYEPGDILLYFMTKEIHTFEGKDTLMKRLSVITYAELDEFDKIYEFVEYDKDTPVFRKNN